MSTCPRDRASRLRGAAAGLLTAALAVAAHGAASGTPPVGAASALLAVLAATIGALAATIRGAGDTRVLLVLLASGQLFGHLMLDAAGHGHESAAAPPEAAMLIAHAAAVALGAVLISLSDRLCAAMSRALRIRTGMRSSRPAVPTAPLVVSVSDQPLRSSLLLAASVSHRGPPVSSAR